MSEDKKITIYDIAQMTGFSPKTVSRVVNGGENVKKDTYEKIKQTLDEYNYVPNIYAQNLTSKTNKNILLSVRERKNFPLNWFYILLERVIIECRKYNMNVIVEYFNDENNIKSSLLYSSSSFIDATVIFYEQENDERVNFLNKIGSPFLIFGKSQTQGIQYVTNDDYQALYDLTDYLLSQGLRHILLLMGGSSLVNVERVKGAKDAYRDKEIDSKLLQVEYGMTSIEDVYQYSVTTFSKNNVPDAIFVSGDEKVIGLMKALKEVKVNIPEDVSVIGFDNIPLSEYMTPALTTIAQDYDLLAIEIAQRLEKLIKGNKKLTSIEVPTKLIMRESVKLK